MVIPHFFFNWNFLNKIVISWWIGTAYPTDNTSVLEQLVAWHLAGDIPLPELMITQFTDAHVESQSLKC